jgi:hypothetical protein
MQPAPKMAGTKQYFYKFLPPNRAYFATCYALKNHNTFGYIRQRGSQNHTKYDSIRPSFKHLLNNKTGLQRSPKPHL